MIKKLAVLILVLVQIFVLALSITACDPATVEVETERINETSMFVVVETTSDWEVVYHKDTKVMYVYSWATTGNGQNSVCNSGFTVLLNADGTPMLWKGE